MNYIEALIAEALITAPGCPETLVERALRVSANEFYRDSESWRITTDAMPVIKGRTEVELDVGADMSVVRVFWARLDGVALTAMSARNLAERSGTPRGYVPNEVYNTVLLDAAPTESYLRNGLVLNLALAPDHALNEIPNELFNAHRNGILYGAQRMLLVMPNVPWGNMNGAQAFAMMFEGEKAKARRIADARQAGVARKVRYGGL
jgi:hypothetical protein